MRLRWTVNCYANITARIYAWNPSILIMSQQLSTFLQYTLDGGRYICRISHLHENAGVHEKILHNIWSWMIISSTKGIFSGQKGGTISIWPANSCWGQLHGLDKRKRKSETGNLSDKNYHKQQCRMWTNMWSGILPTIGVGMVIG